MEQASVDLFSLMRNAAAALYPQFLLGESFQVLAVLGWTLMRLRRLLAVLHGDGRHAEMHLVRRQWTTKNATIVAIANSVKTEPAKATAKADCQEAEPNQAGLRPLSFTRLSGNRENAMY